MTTSGVIVSLMLNAIGSFAVGVLVVLSVAAVFRIREGRVRVALLCLPFLKLVVDLARSATDVSWIGVVPSGPRSLAVGLDLAPPLALRVQVLLSGLVEGKQRVFSAGDFVVDTCLQSAPALLPLLAIALGLPSAVLLGRRLWCYAAFEKARRRHRSHASRVERVVLGWRSVDLYEAPSTVSVPFSGGILKPYVCIPESIATRLSASEYRGVVQHELAHIRFCDLALLTAVGVLTDVFWFVPGIRALAKSLAFACELCADSHATRQGIPHSVLASALVRVAESMSVRPLGAPVTPIGSSRGQLVQRVHRLVRKPRDPGPPSRARLLLFDILRWSAFAVAAQSVYASVLGGF